MAEPDFVSYRILSIDGGLRSIAARYNTTVAEIWDATYPRLYSRGRKHHDLKSAAEFEQAIGTGDRIILPFKGDNQDWVLTTQINAETLADLCLKKNAEPARRGGMTLTPAYLWGHVLNAELRAWVLSTLPTDEERRKLDGDPSRARVAGLTALIPYPIRPIGGVISAAPVAVGASQMSGTVEVTPKWITDLASRLRQIEDATDRLCSANKAVDLVRREGMAACSTLVLVQKLLEILAAHTTHQPSLDALKKFDEKHLALLRLAVDKLYFGAPAMLLPALEVDRASQADELFQLVSDLELAALCEQAMLEDPIVDGSRLTTRACVSMESAYRELAISPRSDDVVQQMEKELKRVGQALKNAPAVEGASALGVLLSFAGTATSTVGNLPGPASLAVACLESVALHVLPLLLRNKSAPERAKALFDVLVKVLGYPEEGINDLKEAVLRGGVLRADADGNPIERGLGARGQIRDAAERLATKVQTSRGWHSALLLLSALALLGAIQAEDDLLGGARKVANIVGCSVNMAVAFTQTIESLAPTEVLGSALLRFGKVGGTIPLVASILVGGMTLYEGQQTGNNKTMLLGGAQVFGSLGALAGFLWGHPVLQLTGVAILVGVALYSNYEGFNELTECGTKKVVLAQFLWLEKHPTFGKALTLDADLAKAFQRVKDAIKADSVALFCIERSTEAMQELGGLGFATTEVDLIAPIPLPLAPSIFWGAAGTL